MSQVNYHLQVEQADWNEAQGTRYSIYRECHWTGYDLGPVYHKWDIEYIFKKKKSVKAPKSPFL